MVNDFPEWARGIVSPCEDLQDLLMRDVQILVRRALSEPTVEGRAAVTEQVLAAFTRLGDFTSRVVQLYGLVQSRQAEAAFVSAHSKGNA